MLKVYYRQKFRVRNTLTKKVERLNQSVNKNGDDIWVQGFDTLAECVMELNRFVTLNPKYRPYLKIETYSDDKRNELNISSETSKKLIPLKLFSGKGLAENSGIPKRDENKYASGKWYSREINFAQSADRNKGLSTIHKLKDKVKDRNTGADITTYFKLRDLQDTSFKEYNVAESVRNRFAKGEFNNRKEIKLWLKDRGYSVRDTRRILSQVF